MMTASAQHSNNSDTSMVSISRKDALKTLQKAYEAKALEAQRDLLLNQVDTLKARIVIKENIIATMQGKIEDYKSIVTSKDAIISAHVDKEKIMQVNTDYLTKQLKKQKNKNKWTAFLGILTTAGALTLFIMK